MMYILWISSPDRCVSLWCNCWFQHLQQRRLIPSGIIRIIRIWTPKLDSRRQIGVVIFMNILKQSAGFNLAVRHACKCANVCVTRACELIFSLPMWKRGKSHKFSVTSISDLPSIVSRLQAHVIKIFYCVNRWDIQICLETWESLQDRNDVFFIVVICLYDLFHINVMKIKWWAWLQKSTSI